MDIQEFVKTINALRLANKNGWYIWQGEVNNKVVNIKGYGTWLQIFTVDGLRQNTIADISVAEFKQELLNGLS
jgi:hypothetical protein